MAIVLESPAATGAPGAKGQLPPDHRVPQRPLAGIVRRLDLLLQPVDLVAKGDYPPELSVQRVRAQSKLSMDRLGLTITCVIIRRRSG